MTNASYQGPLAGLNVVDFGHFFAGPMVGMLFADQGATVVRIVKPRGPTSREQEPSASYGKEPSANHGKEPSAKIKEPSAKIKEPSAKNKEPSASHKESSTYYRELPEQQYRLLNRNKKLLTLDLKTDEGRAQALSLIKNADVVIENFRPGVMKRLGLDYAAVKALNPGLVYLSLPGFASTDKQRAHIQAWEGVLGAAVGLYTDTHWMRQKLRFPPLYSWVPHCSAYGGMQGTIAVMAALVAREKCGRGTVIETPLVDAGLAGFTLNCMAIGPTAEFTELPSAFKPYEYSPADDRTTQLDKLTKGTWDGVTPSGRVYACADGRRILIWCTDGPFAWEFLTVIGLAEKVRRQGFVDAGLWDSCRADDNISASYLLRPALRQRLIEQIAEVMLTKGAQEWEDLLTQKGLLAVVVRTRAEYLALESMHASGVLVKMGEGETQLTVPGRIVDVSGPGEESMEGFEEAKTITAAEAQALLTSRALGAKPRSPGPCLRKGDLLKGLKLLDLSNVVAGPVGAWTLAEYGADVIKAAPPSYLHPLILPQTMAVNQGKRSILLNPGTAPGRQIFERLVSWADVVLHNSLDHTAQRLGATHRQLRTINPRVVSCQFSAFGGSFRGGWEGRRGFDPVACMATGMMAHYGTVEQPQPHGSTSCGDVMGGLCAAFASLLAIYQQRKTGYGGEARTSLVRANNYIQLPYMITDRNGHSDWGEPHGQFALGESWHQRLYRCRDGWIYVGALEKQAGALEEIVAGERGTERRTMEMDFTKQGCAHWLAKLAGAGIACHRVESIAELRARSTRCVNNEAADETRGDDCEALCWESHPCGKSVTLMNPKQVRVGEARSYTRLAPAPRFGQHTKEILRELGYSNEQIEELIRLKVAHEYLSELGDKNKYFFE